MNRTRWMRAIAVALILPLLLTGCWDSREIDALFILTGTALDVSDIPGHIIVTLQVTNIKEVQSSSEGGGTDGGGPVIILRADDDSLMDGIAQINRNSNHKLLYQHNQVRLFGTALAEQGIERHLDSLLREQQARLEVPLAVVDGRAEEALTAKLSQDPNTGIFLRGMFQEQSKISSEYEVRLIDFVHRLLDESAAPVMPLIKVTSEGDKQEIGITGMAIFKGDRMVGKLSNDETLGYIWSFGNVKRCNFKVTDSSNMAVLHITGLDCKRDVTLRQDGGVSVDLSIDAVVGIAELSGFQDMKPPELLEHLENLAEEEIKAKIMRCFAVAKSLDADIFEFSSEVYQNHPQQWEAMKGRWDAIFSDIDLSVQAKVRIPETGQIVQSLEMEAGMR